MEIENHLHTYNGAKAIMFPSGDLGIALEIGTIADFCEVLDIEGDGKAKDMHIGILEPMGYLIYHPEFAGGASLFWQSLDLIEDLGKI